MDWSTKLSQGLSYDAFLERHGSPEHRRRWADVYEQTRLSEAQRSLLAGFRRAMDVLCLAGAWCGDCVHQCPIWRRFEEASSCIRLRFFDRDEHDDLRAALSVCGGARVPVVVFLNEDAQEVARFGDRTLAKYRALAAELEGAACPTGLVADPESLRAEVIHQWLEQFERAQLIMRTSPRLRERHGD